MSGRSAYVRAKNTERADKSHHKVYPEYVHDDHFLYSYTTNGTVDLTPPTPSSNTSYVSSPRPSRRRQSISSTSSAYGYPVCPPMRKPRPIIVASAIEKSDFRTHFDGMSSTLRCKLGRLLKGGEDHSGSNRRRPGTANGSSDSESRSPDFTPSVTAVPSLSPSTSPEIPAPFSAAHHPTTHAMRAKQQNEAVIHKIRRFEGGGKLPQLGWKSLSNVRRTIPTSPRKVVASNASQNPELWDENGDTFVYMYMHGSKTKPPPSFRINSKVIEQSGSKIFVDKLVNPTEPAGWPRFHPCSSSQHESRSISSEGPPEHFEDFRHGILHAGPRSDSGDGDSLHPLHVSSKHRPRVPRGIKHEIYVPWPGSATEIHSTIWHITTRNFFAIMYDASALVGTTLFEAMSILFQRITLYPDYLDRNISPVAWLTDYVVRHKFDDVRNNPSYAASLLAFSELPGVQWKDGYIEAFVHCVGMLNMGLQTIPEWRYITPHTKMFLQNANMEVEERIHRAQVWLFSFDFTEMWPTTSAPPSSARGCFDRFRRWLCKYYENAFLHWPPTNELTWLTRDMVLRLRNDFHGLYDYLVDRDVLFDGSEYRPGQKWAITSKTGHGFRADTSELPLTDILLGFDERNGFPHVPHPYPIVPVSMPVHGKPKSSFTLKKPTSPADLVAQARRKALSYAEASNVYNLRDQYMHTDLVTNFMRFEQNDMVENLDPFEARRGRWVLIYGILQVLATVSVDSPNLRYSEGAQYHLSPQMKGIVPWGERGSPPEEEAEHTRSHCWIVPGTWGASVPKARPGAHKPIIWGQYGDGRSRADTPEKESPPPRQRDMSVGRKRAEEWVATHAGRHREVSDGDLTGSDGENNGDTSAADVPSGSSEEYPTNAAAQAARRRRALVHGFTDFEVPRDW